MIKHRTWQLVAASIAAAALAGCAHRTAFARYPGAAKMFNPKSSDAKAVAIANQVFATAGGTANWAKAKQIRWKEAIVQDGKVALAGAEAWDRWNGRHWGRLDSKMGSVVVMHHLYNKSGAAYLVTTSGVRHQMPSTQAQQAIAMSMKRWRFDTAALCMQFLLKSPGTHLKYVGPVKDDQGQPDLQDVQVTFDPADKTRTGVTYHVIVNKNTHMIVRLEIKKNSGAKQGLIGYALKNWTTVNGLKFPTLLQNLGYKGEQVQMKDIRVSTEPDDSLYVPSVSAATGG